MADSYLIKGAVLNMLNDIRVVATDLDGTLIPVCAQSQLAMVELKTLIEKLGLKLVFVTGRSVHSVEEAIEEFCLPSPDFIIADVGSRIYKRQKQTAKAIPEYDSVLADRLEGIRLPELATKIEQSHFVKESWSLRSQEQANQTEFKQSFYCTPHKCEEAAAELKRYLLQSAIPCSVVSSIDPEAEHGLIDLLPFEVDKGFSLSWWAEHLCYSLDEILFFGDSGNDLSAFRSGVRSTLVGNATQGLYERVIKDHSLPMRVYQASKPATAGVLEGMQHFLKLSV